LLVEVAHLSPGLMWTMAEFIASKISNVFFFYNNALSMLALSCFSRPGVF